MQHTQTQHIHAITRLPPTTTTHTKSTTRHVHHAYDNCGGGNGERARRLDDPDLDAEAVRKGQRLFVDALYGYSPGVPAENTWTHSHIWIPIALTYGFGGPPCEFRSNIASERLTIKRNVKG